MASLLKQLATIILVATILQTLVKSQNVGGEEENDNSYVQKLINALIKYREALKEERRMSETSDSLLNVDDTDDDRQSRSNFNNGGKYLCMEETIGYLNLGSNYKPGYVEEYGCYPVTSESYTSVIKDQKKLCYVEGNGCHSRYQNIAVYKRESGNHCWVSETRNVSIGCNCHFPSQHFGYKPYRP